MKLFVVKSRKNGQIMSEHVSKQDAKSSRDKLNGKKPEESKDGKPQELLEYYITKGTDHWLYGRPVRIYTKGANKNKRRINRDQ